MFRSSLSWIALTMAVLGLCISTAIDLAQAQKPTQPIAKRPQRPESPGSGRPVSGSRSTTSVGVYGGYPGYSGGGTAAGNALNGMGSVISSAGDYNLSTSEAAINMTEAQRKSIENRQYASSTYFDMRAANRAAREAEAGPKPTEEQLVRIAHYRVPKPLNTMDVDPVSGKIDWPSVLQDEPFQSPREEVNKLFAKRATNGGLGYSDQSRAREWIDGMADQLKGMISDIQPRDYTVSKQFLRSLMYAATKSDL